MPDAPRTRQWSLQTRTLVILAATTVGLVVALYLPLRTMLLGSFLDLEATVAHNHLDRARFALDVELDRLWSSTRDYATWDDTYGFLGGQLPDYATSNFVDTTFDFNKLSLVALFDLDGKLRWAKGYDLTARREVPPPPEITGLSLGDALLTPPRPGQRVAGLIKTRTGPMLVAAVPVRDSKDQAPPRGTLVMGHHLDPLEVKSLAERLKMSLTVLPMGQSKDAPQMAGSERTRVRLLDDDTLAGFARVDDVYGRPYLVLRVVLPRDVYRRGEAAAGWLGWAVLAASLAFGLAVLVAVQRFVVGPVAALGQRVREVAARKDHSLRLPVWGDDEIARLGDDINGMLAGLEDFHQQLDVERRRSEKLLRNILPRAIADRLKDKDEVIAESYREVSVLFADLVGFTEMAARTPPAELVRLLDGVFSTFDELADRYGLEKIKTIGDAYMVVAGVPEPCRDHADKLARMALDMVQALERVAREHDLPLKVRIGLHSGPVVAGVIGRRKFSYDLWGDTVNVASRMESSGLPGRVQVGEATFRLLQDRFDLEPRGTVTIKGKGEMATWWLKGERDTQKSSTVQENRSQRPEAGKVRHVVAAAGAVAETGTRLYAALGDEDSPRTKA